jgi:hypothetical protein
MCCTAGEAIIERMLQRSLIGAVFAAVCLAVTPIAFAQEAEEEAEKVEDKKEEPSTMKTVLSYGLALGGFVVVGALVVHTLTRSMRYPDARNSLIMLLRANPNQAEYRCLLLPHTFHEPVAAALKTGGMTQSTDLKIVQAATVPTFDAIGGMVVQHWKGLITKAKLATIASVGGFILAVTKGGFPVLIFLISLSSVGGLVWLFVFLADIERSVMRARVEVLPDVDRAIVEGRYQAPPPG